MKPYIEPAVSVIRLMTATPLSASGGGNTDEGLEISEMSLGRDPGADAFHAPDEGILR